MSSMPTNMLGANGGLLGNLNIPGKPGGFVNTLLRGLAMTPDALAGMSAAQNVLLRMQHAKMQQSLYERMLRRDQMEQQQHEYERKRQQEQDELRKSTIQSKMVEEGWRPASTDEIVQSMTPRYKADESGNLTPAGKGYGGVKERLVPWRGEQWIAPTEEENIERQTKRAEAKSEAESVLPSPTIAKEFGLDPNVKIRRDIYDNYVNQYGANVRQRATASENQLNRDAANKRNSDSIASREKIAGNKLARGGGAGGGGGRKGGLTDYQLDQISKQHDELQQKEQELWSENEVLGKILSGESVTESGIGPWKTRKFVDPFDGKEKELNASMGLSIKARIAENEKRARALQARQRAIRKRHGLEEGDAPPEGAEAPAAKPAQQASSQYTVGQTVKLRDGKVVTIKKINPDGTFDY